MNKSIPVLVMALFALVAGHSGVSAKVSVPTQILSPTASVSGQLTQTLTPFVVEERPDLTQKTQTAAEPLKKILDSQEIGSVLPNNFIKYAIRNSVNVGVPINTVVLILLLPLVTAVISAIRQLIGLRGFGIYLPASLAVVFVATGPVIGIALFLIIVFVSTLTRMILRKLKIKLQYLPRMSLILWAVSVGVLGVLFLTPVIRYPGLTNVSIFAVLILALLTEDFIRIQLGKSVKTAIRLTSETIILSVVSFLVLTYEPVQAFTLLHPEIYLLLVFVADLLLGRYTGLRVMELWRFRKLLTSKQ